MAKRRRTSAEWERVVRQWERSGLSAREFAARRGLVARTLVWWRWRLRRDGEAASAAIVKARPSRPSTPRVDFVPVEVEDADDARTSTPSEVAWELHGPEGHVLRVFSEGTERVLAEAVLSMMRGPRRR